MDRGSGVKRLGSLLKKYIFKLLLFFSTIIMLIPIYYMAIGAFKSRSDIIKYPFSINPPLFTLDNFGYVIKKIDYWRALYNTAFITVMSLFIVVVCASLAGFAISRLRSRISDFYYKMVVTLMVIPFIGCLLPLAKLSDQLGFYDSIWGCIFIQTAWSMPFAVFLYAGFMGDLPKELEEAAYMDGCSIFSTYSRVFLPLLGPVTAACCIRQGVGIWNDYLVSRTLLNENHNPTLMVGITSFFGARGSELGYAFTGMVLVSVPLVIMFLFLQKNFIKGITAGAVKG